MSSKDMKNKLIADFNLDALEQPHRFTPESFEERGGFLFVRDLLSGDCRSYLVGKIERQGWDARVYHVDGEYSYVIAENSRNTGWGLSARGIPNDFSLYFLSNSDDEV